MATGTLFTHFITALENTPAIAWTEAQDGIVCNYEDGSDYEILRQPPQDPAEWISGFLRTQDLRTQFLHALQWWASSNKHLLTITATGKCHMGTDGVSSELDLGKELTQLLKEHDLHGTTEQLNSKYYFHIKPDEFKKALVLGPFDSHKTDPVQVNENAADTGICLTTMILGGYIQIDDEDLKNAAAAGEKIDPAPVLRKYPEIEFIAKLQNQFKDKFFIDICDEDHFQIEYDDEDNGYKINRAQLSRDLQHTSADALLERTIADYHQSNASYMQARTSLLSHMASLGYAMDDEWIDKHIHYFGKTHREFPADLDHLTKGSNAQKKINDWLTENNLPLLPTTPTSHSITEKPLPKDPPTEIPPLSHYQLEKIDAIAAAHIKNLLENGWNKSPHSYWASPLWHQPEKDTWYPQGWWREQAAKHEDGTLLSTLGDEAASQRNIDHMKSIQDFGWSAGFTIYEGYSAIDVYAARLHGNVWQDDPILDFYEEAASEHWLSHFPDVPYEFKRHAADTIAEALMDEEETNLETIDTALRVIQTGQLTAHLPHSTIQAITKTCQDYASGKFHQTHSSKDFLTVSHYLRIPGIAATLRENTSFWQLWIGWPDIMNYFSGEFCLALSLHDAPEVTQRLAAAVLLKKPPHISKYAYARQLKGIADIVDINELAQNIAESDDADHKEQQLAAAIAWTRSRSKPNKP